MDDPNENPEAADKWEIAARINGYVCDRCGDIPPYVERELYFETKLCGWCNQVGRKDD